MKKRKRMVSDCGFEINSVKFNVYLYDNNEWIINPATQEDSLPGSLKQSKTGQGFSSLIENMANMRADIRNYLDYDKRERLKDLQKMVAELEEEYSKVSRKLQSMREELELLR